MRRPARVSFRTNPLLDAPQYGIRHDQAYWVSQLRGRAAGPLSVDLTSHGCGVTAPVNATRQDAGTSPVPWVSLEQHPTGATHLPAAQLLEGTLTGVGSLTVDLAGACLRPEATYRLTSDGPVQLRVAGRLLQLPKGTSTGRI